MFKKIRYSNFRILKLLRSFTTKLDCETTSKKKQKYGHLFPEILLNRKRKTPANMYIANEKIAEEIDKNLDPYFRRSSCDTIVEINPGTGFFTRKLLNRETKFKKIILFESMEFFINNLHELHNLYPDRVKVKCFDFIQINKLVFMDKMDNGTRVVEILDDIPIKPFYDEPNMLLFGVVGSYLFFKHLIISLVFRNSFLNFGRAEMYLIVPPPIYLHLTCNKDIGYMLYRSTSILFQIFFEHRFIASLPRNEFIPTQKEYDYLKYSKLAKVHSVNPDLLYLIRVVPRQNLHDLCPPEYLPTLWYFIRQNCVSRRNRVIPNLEKWIPGCGQRLIIDNHPPIIKEPMYFDEDETKIPKFSSRCMKIKNEDFFTNLNIYTQFGDLSPSQFLNLFNTFRHWPEYKDSSFIASFENNMLKFETSEDAVNDSMGEEDDISAQIPQLIEETEEKF